VAMSLKRILVPLDASIFSEGAARAACQIAKAHGATLSGVAVLDSPEIRSSLVPAVGPYYPMMLDAVQEKITHADHVLKDTLNQFSRLCESAEVSHLETEYEGIPAQKLLESSIFYDLIVMGLETAFHFETRVSTGDTLDKLLDHTATPVLAVPPEGLPSLERVAIAFDGSFSSSRALRDFMLMAFPFAPEILLIVADTPFSEAEFLLNNARSLLQSHGFGRVEVMISEEEVGSTFDDRFLDGFDLVVAGIHSRRKLRDLFTGSFTARLIRDGTTPLFLSH
ncbi:MAG: universal stress protein, partial [Verrucomicrobiota bacterium]